MKAQNARVNVTGNEKKKTGIFLLYRLFDNEHKLANFYQVITYEANSLREIPP